MSETGGSLDGTLINELKARRDLSAIPEYLRPSYDAPPAPVYKREMVWAPEQVNFGASAHSNDKPYGPVNDGKNTVQRTSPKGAPQVTPQVTSQGTQKQSTSEGRPDDYSGIDNVYIATYRAPVHDSQEILVYDKYPEGHSEAWLENNKSFYRLVQNRPGLSADDRVKETLETEEVAFGYLFKKMPTNRRVELWGDNLTPELTIPESLTKEERDEFVLSQRIGVASAAETTDWGTDRDAHNPAKIRNEAEGKTKKDPQAAATASPLLATARAPSLAASPITSRATAPLSPRVVSPEATGAQSAASATAAGASGTLIGLNAAAVAVQSAEHTAALGADATAAAAPATTASPAPSVSATRAAAPALTASPSVVSQRSDAAAAETTTSQAPSTPAAQAATPALTASPRAVSQRSDTEAAETTAIPAPSAPAARAAAPALTASPRVVSQRSDAKAADEPVITEPAAKLPRRTRAPDSSADLVQKLNDIELWLGEIASLLKKKSSSSGDGTYSGMHALADELVRLIRYSADRESSRRGWY